MTDQNADMPVAPRVVCQVAEAIGWTYVEQPGLIAWANWDLRKMATTGQAALTTDDMLAWLMARGWAVTIQQPLTVDQTRGLVNASAVLDDDQPDPKTALGVGRNVWDALVRLVGRVAGIPLTDRK